MEITTNSVDETRAFGAKIAQVISPSQSAVLTGDLGCGKTEIVRGFITELHSLDIVKSPSFSLVNTYQTASLSVHHFDFYRLNFADELFEIGYDEYIDDENAFVFIEWGEMFEAVLPEGVFQITIKSIGENSRIITVDNKLSKLLERLNK